MKVRFCGAVGQVTGSMFELLDEKSGVHGLVDCGSVQGGGESAPRSDASGWPFEPTRLQFVLLTHAHLDHCGELPRLVRDGFDGVIYCTPVTRALVEVSLRDGARHSASYTSGDVDRLMESQRWNTAQQPDAGGPAWPLTLADGTALPLEVNMLNSSHLMGAVGYAVSWRSGRSRHGIVFYGDSGPRQSVDGAPGEDAIERRKREASLAYRPNDRFDPDAAGWKSHCVVLESTYGERVDESAVPHFQRLEALHHLLKRTANDGRTLLIPTFAIGRTQDVLMDIALLRSRLKGLERLRVQCPAEKSLGAQVGEVMVRHCGALDHDWLRTLSIPGGIGPVPFFQAGLGHRWRFLSGDSGRVRHKWLENKVRARPGMYRSEHGVPTVIVGPSGMGAGGRMAELLEHARTCARTTVAMVGYACADSPLGRLRDDSRAMDGPRPVACEVVSLKGYGGHAFPSQLASLAFGALPPDGEDGLPAMSSVQSPTMTFLVHGEDWQRERLREYLHTQAAARGMQADIRLPGTEMSWYDLDVKPVRRRG